MSHTLAVDFCIVFLLFTLCSAQWFDDTCRPFVRAPQEASSIHDLTPGDIKVFMAIGDSITAGFGVNNYPWEDRGWSFAIGGEKDVVTLPNLFKAMYPYQTYAGASVSWHAKEGPGADNHRPSLDNLNGAQSGAVIAQVIPDEIGYLYDTLKKSPGVDFDNDWKYLNILIGSNDLCGSCKAGNLNQTQFADNVNQILTSIHEKFPRTLVGVMGLLKLSNLKNLEKSDDWCKLLHDVYAECECVFRGDDNDLATTDEHTVLYNQAIRDVVGQWQQVQDDQFAVVYLDFFEHYKVDDSKWTSKVDCFHPSAIAHARAAVDLWNSLLVDLNSSPLPSSDGSPHCPTSSTRLRTRQDTQLQIR